MEARLVLAEAEDNREHNGGARVEQDLTKEGGSNFENSIQDP
jgi:hypothetical protein